MSAQTFEMELVEYRAGDAFFQLERLVASDVSLVLPLPDWDALGRPSSIRVSVEVTA